MSLAEPGRTLMKRGEEREEGEKKEAEFRAELMQLTFLIKLNSMA